MATQNFTLTQEQAKNLFNYKDGELYWKNNVGAVKAGSKAGSINMHKYISVVCNKERYQAHRIIYLMHYGYTPEFVDHIDGNRSNNFIENLRPATKSQNSCNQKINTKNTSGYKNVYWHKSYKKWRVSLVVKNKKIHVGTFLDLELAGLVASMAREKYHGEFARHG